MIAAMLFAGIPEARASAVLFSPTVTAGETRLELKGTARLRYLFFIDAYDGALYLPRETSAASALEDIPRHLELGYHVAISAQDLARATTAKIQDAVDPETFERLRPKIEALNRLYRNVAPGDRYALTYVPGTGTRLLFNGKVLGIIGGAAFSRALFSIWIGDSPIDTDFRNQLLGQG